MSISNRLSFPRVHSPSSLPITTLFHTGLIKQPCNYLLFVLLFLLNPAQADTFRFASWNIENFWHVEGKSLRGPYKHRDTVRFARHYDLIREVIARLDADVWALQEIGSPEAARHLFPSDKWHLVFSKRFKPGAERDIYTALAVDKSTTTVLATQSIPLNVTERNRAGTAALLTAQNQEIWVASIHLKSGCRSDDLVVSDREACQVLAQQLPILETWIDVRLDQKLLIGGDFNRTFMGKTLYQPGEDPVWLDLADGMPSKLLSFPFTPHVNCPEGRFGNRTWPVDFILTSQAVALRVKAGPYVQSMGGNDLSDHCPVVVELTF